jgi:hypothetical protein
VGSCPVRTLATQMQPHDPNPTAATKPFPSSLPLGHTSLNRRTSGGGAFVRIGSKGFKPGRTGRCEAEGAAHELGRGCCRWRERDRGCRRTVVAVVVTGSRG